MIRHPPKGPQEPNQSLSALKFWTYLVPFSFRSEQSIPRTAVSLGRPLNVVGTYFKNLNNEFIVMSWLDKYGMSSVYLFCEDFSCCRKVQ
jgi:hypothetical protein